MSRLAFNERGHRYLLDGELVQSVTQVTGSLDKPGMLVSAVDHTAMWAALNRESYDLLGEREWIAAAKRARNEPWNKARDDGTKMHRLAESLVYGTPMPDELDGEPVSDDVAALAEQVARFYDAWEVQPVVHETLIYHERNKYAGRFDLVADLRDGQRWLLDYKSGKGVYPEHALQATAYRYATHYVDRYDVDQPMSELGIEETGVVHVRPDNWELVPVRSDPVMAGYFNHLQHVAYWAKWKREDTVRDPLPKPERIAS